MSILVEFELASDDFELGRVFSRLDPAASVELESLVSVPQSTLPFVWITGPNHSTLEDLILHHPTVKDVEHVDEFENRSLYALNWTLEYDHLFRYFRENDIQILAAGATNGHWTFILRFRAHSALSAFQEYIEAAQVSVDVTSVRNLRDDDQTTFYGLTEAQRETLTLAVREGYYDIPRDTSTSDLSERFGISDQAVTERLRRAIAMLVRNTLMIEGYHRFRR
jgi:predicted DNA binding protein